MLAAKGTNRAGDRALATRQGQGIIRAGYGLTQNLLFGLIF